MDAVASGWAAPLNRASRGFHEKPKSARSDRQKDAFGYRLANVTDHQIVKTGDLPACSKDPDRNHPLAHRCRRVGAVHSIIFDDPRLRDVDYTLEADIGTRR
jgi:hypothetical protein